MNKLSKKLFIIFLAITITILPIATAFALEEAPVPEGVVEEAQAIEAPIEAPAQTPVIEAEAPVQLEQSVAEPETQPEAVTQVENTGVQGFVTRMYQVCLNREPDAQGLQEWSNKLTSGSITGADTAYGFIFSPEFLAKNLSDTDYIKALYAAFFGREADPEGLAAWQKVIDEGYSRMYLLSGFVNSQEFMGLCNSYGITKGELKLSPSDLTPSISVFVKRMYRLCLYREADTAGLNAWTAALQSKQITGAQAAYGFVFSPEFTNKNLTNSEFVDIMYEAFFNRTADSVGKHGWNNALDKGEPRHNVLAGFTNSVEFGELCTKYGIERGTLQTIDPPAPNYDGNFIYTETATEVTITGYKADAPKNQGINIPSHINGKPVTTIRSHVLADADARRFVSAFKDISGPLTIPDTVKNIGDYSFADCQQLTGNLVIPNSVTEIGAGAFSGCSGFSNITLPNNLKTIERSAFSFCQGITSIVIPDSVETIDGHAFASNNNTISVILGKNVKYIGVNAFSFTKISSIIIPDSIEEMGSGAFYACRQLTYAEFLGNKPIINENKGLRDEGIFLKCNDNLKIYYPKNASGWPARAFEMGYTSNYEYFPQIAK